MWLEPWVHTGNKFHAMPFCTQPGCPRWTEEKHIHTGTFCLRGLNCECGLQNRSLGEGASSTARGCPPRLDGAGTVPAKAPVFITIAVFLQVLPGNGCKAPLLTSRSLNMGRATLNRVGIFQCPEHRCFFFFFPAISVCIIFKLETAK